MRIITKTKVNWDLSKEMVILEEQADQGLSLIDPVAIVLPFSGVLMMAVEIIKYQVQQAGRRIVNPHKDNQNNGVLEFNPKKEKT